MAVIVAVEPGATLGFVHETGAMLGQVQVPPPVVTTATETKVVFAGVASVTVEAPQFEGPLLVMIWVYVMLDPAVTGLGVPEFVTFRSQATLTFVVTLVLLLDDSGSEVVAETDEVAVMELAVTVGATPRTTMMSVEVPDATLGFVQVIVPVPPTVGVVQLHPAGCETDWKVVFAGVTWVNVAPEALAGPLFVTVCVYVMSFPASTADGVATVLSARSA